ncbi:MAG: hypothetical protein ACOYM5_06205 [Caulobacter sp.]
MATPMAERGATVADPRAVAICDASVRAAVRASGSRSRAQASAAQSSRMA